MSSGLLILLVLYLFVTLLVVGLLAVVYCIFNYNRFVRLLAHVETALSDIDVLLTKRNNLIPNLVEVVQGYAGHESGVLQEVTALRNRALQATTVGEKAQVEDSMRGLFKGLFAVAENYPQLKADANFRQLQQSLQELEDSIEAVRRSYNGTVRAHNVLLKSFPSNMVGKLFGRTSCSFFVSKDELERQSPKIDLK
jgi:LemA protein